MEILKNLAEADKKVITEAMATIKNLTGAQPCLLLFTSTNFSVLADNDVTASQIEAALSAMLGHTIVEAPPTLQ